MQKFVPYGVQIVMSANPRDYWFKMKKRVKTEDGFELSIICRQFKLKAIDVKGIFRLIICTRYWISLPCAKNYTCVSANLTVLLQLIIIDGIRAADWRLF